MQCVYACVCTCTTWLPTSQGRLPLCWPSLDIKLAFIRTWSLPLCNFYPVDLVLASEEMTEQIHLLLNIMAFQICEENYHNYLCLFCSRFRSFAFRGDIMQIWVDRYFHLFPVWRIPLWVWSLDCQPCCSGSSTEVSMSLWLLSAFLWCFSVLFGGAEYCWVIEHYLLRRMELMVGSRR